MCAKLVFFSMIIGLLSTPTHSFMHPSLRDRLVERRAPAAGKHTQYQTTSGRKTHRKMLPYVSSSITNSLASQNLSLTKSIPIYFILTNMAYLFRRSHIRDRPKRELIKIRLARGDGVSLPLRITNIFVWQFFVIFIFPLLEPTSRVFGYVSFYYFYPNAGGLGIIFEPLSAQSYSMSKRSKSQIRCDWHRFSVNVGAIGRDGYRHPPAKIRNLPHIDIPARGWKHWPWRRKNRVGIPRK